MIPAAVFWGINYAATKFAALYTPPLSTVTIRFLMGGILMYCVLRSLDGASNFL